MQGYLFPLQRTGKPDPYQTLIESTIPAAQHSVFVIDPSPPDELVRVLSDIDNPRVSKRMLIRKDILNTGDATPPDIMKMDTRTRISNSRIQVRAINCLTARLVIVDDSAHVISGEYGSNLNWGIELNPIDSQPVADYWNSVYQDAFRVSDSYAIDIWDQYLEKFWSGRILPRDVIALYNNRGVFLAIHVRIFSGFRQLSLYPFSHSIRSAPKGPVIRWRLVSSKHYQLLGRYSMRIHGLKLSGLIRETPAGSYLLRADIPEWDAMFQERNNDFREKVSEYLDRNYDVMRNEAFRSLDTRYRSVMDGLKNNRQFLPLISDDFIHDEIHEVFQKHYPDKNALLYACQAGYILYGLHPEASGDRVLIQSLSASAATNVLL